MLYVVCCMCICMCICMMMMMMMMTARPYRGGGGAQQSSVRDYILLSVVLNTDRARGRVWHVSLTSSSGKEKELTKPLGIG